MELTSFFEWFIGSISGVISLLRSAAVFKVFGISVSFFDLIIAFFVMAMIVNIFWKGAKA